MRLLTIDVETTMNAPDVLGKSHPMWPENKVVLLGVQFKDDELPAKATHIVELPFPGMLEYSPAVDFIVGCNLSFDLCYLYRNSEIKRGLQSLRLWDIQLAEYLLSGQQSKWPSLDEMSIKYGLPVKDDKVTKFFEAGIGADAIGRDILDPYLKHDLDNTEKIAILQMARATDSKQLNLIISQMEALHCITEMMFNGLAIDKEYLFRYAGEVANEYADLSVALKAKVAVSPDSTLYPVVDIDSPLQWSKLLFGGELKKDETELVGMYKNGKPKYKKVVKIIITMPLCTDVKIRKEWVSEKTGKISVDDKTITTIIAETKEPRIKSLMESLHQYRELSKQLTTYVQGLSKHIISSSTTTYIQDYIHGKLNQTATSTGRLASSAPNLQNISNNPIKKIFISRWGADGFLVEFDFSQLEVAVLAHLTMDKQLVYDISHGKDIHTELYKDMFGKEPSKEERKWFKTLTFGLIYGAGAKTLAENSGKDISLTKNFIDTFYKRYSGVRRWNEKMATDATILGTHEDLKVPKTWRHQAETGRVYVFNEYPSKYDTTKAYNFSPTELKNYPVQGLATGDIVPMMLGILFRKLLGRDKVKLVNTVHDSIMLDVHTTVLDSTVKEVKEVLNNTDQYYQKTFGIPLALKLSVGVTIGKNWFEA